MSISDMMFLGYMQVNSLRLFLSCLRAQCVLLMYCHQGRNQDLNIGGAKHEPKKFQVTWSIKKIIIIMVDKTIALDYHKYLSQEGNNMNQKS